MDNSNKALASTEQNRYEGVSSRIRLDMANVKTSLVFSPPQFRYLKSEAERQGVSLAQVIREVIAEARPGFNDPAHNVITKLPAPQQS